MEPLQTSLRKWMRESSNFQEHFNKMRKDLFADPEIKQIINDNPGVSSADWDRQLIKLYEYSSQSKQCNGCTSLDTCRNLVRGYTPKLIVEGSEIRLSYEMCSKKAKMEEQKRKQSFLQSLYMPKEILHASFDKIDLDDSARFEAIKEAKQYIQSVGTEQASKGLYFYGPFGVGKTYLLGALANQLAEQGVSTMLIYMPEFVREMKSSIQDSSLNTKIERFKRVDVLMLDDIGAESQSAWFRDEVLGSILQYRMMEGLPVFFTSNYNLDELEQHMAATTRGEVEHLKAGRIIERVRQVSKPVSLFAKNRRK